MSEYEGESMPRNENKPIEVRPAQGSEPGWEVARQGDLTPLSTHRTQREAAASAKRLAKRDHDAFVLKGRDGRIRDRASFGNDPRGRG